MKKHKNKKKKNKKQYKQNYFGFSARPKIAGICDSCELFEYGTACNPKGLWCDMKGYLQSDFVQTCKECPNFKEKWKSVSIVSSFSQSAVNNYGDFLGGF